MSFSREDVVALLDVQRKTLNDGLERLQREVGKQAESFNIRLGEVIHSLDFAHAEIRDQKKEIEDINSNQFIHLPLFKVFRIYTFLNTNTEYNILFI